MVPVLIGVVIGRAVETGDVGQLVVWIAVLAALFLLLTFCYQAGARHLMRAIATEGHQLRVELSLRILHPFRLRTPLRSGELLSIAGTDADETSYLLDYVPRIAGSITAIVVCAGVLLTIDVPLGLVVLIGLTWAFFQHLLSGIRHLIMDTGENFELGRNKTSAIATFVGAIVLTAAVWFYVLGVAK
jgi:ABC-type multidrug transport system fused ATPase/permease subunit